MPVIGLNIKSIEAKKEKDVVTSEIGVNSTPKINDVKEMDINTLGKKALSISFDFTTTYSPGIGEIKMTGELLYLADDNKKILAEWKKNKKIPDNVSLEVLNHLFRRCLIKITGLADDLQLPPPIQLPIVKPKPAENKDPAVG